MCIAKPRTVSLNGAACSYYCNEHFKRMFCIYYIIKYVKDVCSCFMILNGLSYCYILFISFLIHSKYCKNKRGRNHMKHWSKKRKLARVRKDWLIIIWQEKIVKIWCQLFHREVVTSQKKRISVNDLGLWATPPHSHQRVFCSQSMNNGL